MRDSSTNARGHDQAFAGRFTADDRLLVVSPHPDDESLAAGGILQSATAAGASVRVLFLTDGENNPWAQRATELRLFVGREQQRRFGDRRRQEAASAMAELRVDGGAASFAGLPDQGLTALLTEDSGRLIEPIAAELQRMRPTLLAYPSRVDLHPDHSATAVAVDVAVRRSAHTVPVRLPYVIHQPVVKSGNLSFVAIALTDEERERKRKAILAHRTQHRLRGPWLASFARHEELFVDENVDFGAGHPIVSARVDDSGLHVDIRSHNYPRAFGGVTLALLIDRWPDAGTAGITLPIPRTSGPVTAPRDSAGLFEEVHWEGRRGRGRLTALPGSTSRATLYAKVIHRFGFFDEAGWRRFEP